MRRPIQNPRFDPAWTLLRAQESWFCHVSNTPVAKPKAWGYLLAAVDGNGESVTDLFHTAITQATDPIRKDCYRDTLDRVEIDGSSSGYRIVLWLKDDLTRKSSDGGCARGNQRTSEPGNRRVA